MPDDETRRPGPSRLIAVVPLAIISAVAFFDALYQASNLAQTADSAQGLVVGHAIAGGNVLLAGWHFPVDNFYFTDSIPYAGAETMVGPRPYLMAVVPALVYAGLVFVALVLCISPKRPLVDGMPALALTTLLFAVPVWVGAWNPMLMSDMHMSTTVAALVALALLARFAESGRGHFAAPLAFLLVILTVASDPFSLVFAYGPAAAVLAIEAARTSHRPAARLALPLLATAIAAGFLLLWAIARVGGFTVENDLAFGFAPLARWWTSFVDLVFGILALWGADPLDVQSISDALMFVMRSFALVIVLFALVCGAQGVRAGKFGLLDRFFCAGAAVSLAVCVPSAQFAKGVKAETMWHGGPPMRFLVPAVMFAGIVACRQLSGIFDFLSGSRANVRLRVALPAVAGMALLTASLQIFLPARAPPWIDRNPGITAARWLEQHRLSQGAGEYWSANLLTAISGTTIGVRSMVPDHNHLVPYLWVEARSAYATPPQFAVWQEPNRTGWTERAVRATWSVSGIRTVAGYRIALLQTSGKFATSSPP